MSFLNNERVKNFPWIPVWTILCNCFIFIITIFLLAFHWSSGCVQSMIFLIFYLILFIGNFIYGFIFHYKYKHNLFEEKKTMLYASLIIFYAVSITLFMVSELLRESIRCENTSVFHSLLRADGIIDCIFLGVFLFYIIITECAQTKKPNNSQTTNPFEEKDVENAKLEKTDYSSKDNPFNYPQVANTPSPNNKPIPPTA